MSLSATGRRSEVSARDTSLPWRRGEFPQRSIVASLNPVIPESIRYGSEECFVRFFRVVESDAQQANHAAPEIAGESSLQPRPTVRADWYRRFLCQHQEKPLLATDAFLAAFRVKSQVPKQGNEFHAKARRRNE